MTSWEDLRLFLACYRSGSATRAARLLETTVSTVSRRLDRLEASLGVALFLRNNDGLSPTDAAERMQEAALIAERKIMEAFHLATAHPEGPEGDVRLAATTDLANFILLPLLRPFLEANPRLHLELILGTERSDLSRREADLAVRIGVSAPDADMVVRHLRNEPMGFFASASYLKQYPASLPLDAHRWLLASGGFEETAIRAWLEASIPNANIVFRSNDFSSIRLAAGAGLGVALLPQMYADITPNMCPVPVPLALPSSPLYLIAHRATRRSAAVRAVWDFIADILISQPGRDDVAILRGALESAYGLHYLIP